MFPNLTNISPGYYQCSKWFEFWKTGGWLVVEKKENEVTITWTSHKNYHNLKQGSAKVITLDQNGNILYYYKTALNLHLVWCHYDRKTEKYYKEALEVAGWMDDLIQQLKIS